MAAKPKTSAGSRPKRPILDKEVAIIRQPVGSVEDQTRTETRFERRGSEAIQLVIGEEVSRADVNDTDDDDEGDMITIQWGLYFQVGLKCVR